MERMVIYRVTDMGLKIGMFSGNILKIKEDCEILKPAMFLSVPRFFNKIHDALRTAFSKATGLKKCLVDIAVKTKLENYEKNGQLKHCLYDRLIFNKIRNMLGGQIEIMATGSAPMSADT